MATLNPQAQMNNSDHEMLINNGRLHPAQWNNPADAFYSGDFHGDYYLAPYFAYSDYSPMGIVVYDQKNRRFMYTSAQYWNLSFSQFSMTGAFSPGNVGKDLLFMDRGWNGNTHAFFKDVTGNGRWLYLLNVSAPESAQTAVAAYNMSALTDIANAKYYAVGTLGSVALYATDRTIYRYDYAGSGQATATFSGFGAGETITGMKIFKSSMNANQTTLDFNATNNTVVFVSTWDGTQGRVYELKMNITSGNIDPTPVKVYDGFGRVMDMTFKFRGTGI
ncbi:hypothetical protein MKQ68_10265 [Chitinophaga horti]|uniref:YD repeat-containing protein n=1 Tax=Chitinophaga horti TaxID=2920382 RepID=A0ABY6J726_9BACT|nr:hypothetical protein [Chitinophaga horti]UYQ95483.1 hypothetical protein MKQ68_10265 [Chitinophaga horti]